MFKPKYTISFKLLDNIKRISILIAELNNRSFPKTVLLEMENRADALSAHSSTSIEGNPLPLTEVKKILKQNPRHIRDTELEVLNYNKAINHLKKLTPNKTKLLDLNLILDIHKLVTNKLLPQAKSGALRKEPVFVNNPQTGKTLYLPPDHQDLKRLISELVDFINHNNGKVDSLILSGIMHKQLVIIHPFIDGNGRTTRLITKHLLANLGLNTFNLFSFENYYNKNVSKYFKQVGVIGNYYEIKEQIDFTSWLEYFTDGIIDELLRVGSELNKHHTGPNTRLESYHQKIIKYIEEHGYINDQLYSKITKRAKATRSLDFKKLIELGILKREGQGRSTYYVLS